MKKELIMKGIVYYATVAVIILGCASIGVSIGKIVNYNDLLAWWTIGFSIVAIAIIIICYRNVFYEDGWYDYVTARKLIGYYHWQKLLRKIPKVRKYRAKWYHDMHEILSAMESGKVFDNANH